MDSWQHYFLHHFLAVRHLFSLPGLIFWFQLLGSSPPGTEEKERRPGGRSLSKSCPNQCCALTRRLESIISSWRSAPGSVGHNLGKRPSCWRSYVRHYLFLFHVCGGHSQHLMEFSFPRLIVQRFLTFIVLVIGGSLRSDQHMKGNLGR